MKDKSRAIRFHQRERLFAKRLKQEHDKINRLTPEDKDWATWNARRRLQTAAICSCWMCGNFRKHSGDTVNEVSEKQLFKLCLKFDE